MLKVGSTAPDFEATQHDGETFNFADRRDGRGAIIFFYIKNFTSG